MGTYVIYRDFTGHAAAVQALGAMYRRLEMGQLLEEEVMALIVFTAFSIEAYVNSLGQVDVEWSERSSWRSKIEKLHALAGRKCDWTIPPLDFAVEVFEIRNHLAHGKPERVEASFVVPAEEAERYLTHSDLTPAWFKPCLSLSWAAASRRRFLPLTSYLGSLFGKTPAHIVHASETHFDRARSDPDAPTSSILEINLPRSILD